MLYWPRPVFPMDVSFRFLLRSNQDSCNSNGAAAQSLCFLLPRLFAPLNGYSTSGQQRSETRRYYGSLASWQSYSSIPSHSMLATSSFSAFVFYVLAS